MRVQPLGKSGSGQAAGGTHGRRRARLASGAVRRPGEPGLQRTIGPDAGAQTFRAEPVRVVEEWADERPCARQFDGQKGDGAGLGFGHCRFDALPDIVRQNENPQRLATRARIAARSRLRGRQGVGKHPPAPSVQHIDPHAFDTDPVRQRIFGLQGLTIRLDQPLALQPAQSEMHLRRAKARCHGANQRLQISLAVDQRQEAHQQRGVGEEPALFSQDVHAPVIQHLNRMAACNPVIDGHRRDPSEKFPAACRHRR